MPGLDDGRHTRPPGRGSAAAAGPGGTYLTCASVAPRLPLHRSQARDRKPEPPDAGI